MAEGLVWCRRMRKEWNALNFSTSVTERELCTGNQAFNAMLQQE
jgi:hypothetical protein